MNSLLEYRVRCQSDIERLPAHLRAVVSLAAVAFNLPVLPPVPPPEAVSLPSPGQVKALATLQARFGSPAPSAVGPAQPPVRGAGGEKRRVPGLVYRHISGRKRNPTTLEIWPKDIKVRRETGRQVGGGKRGKVGTFNGTMGRRIRHFVGNCPELSIPDHTTFVCLTYPMEYPTNGRIVKDHLFAFRHWCSRRDIGGVWVTEFQERGAPHFHLVLDKPVDRVALSAAWYRIVGSGDEKHLRVGTRIEAMRKKEGAAIYMAKYASKQDQKTIPDEFTELGRWWGHWGLTCKPVLVVTADNAPGLATLRAARSFIVSNDRERVKTRENFKVIASDLASRDPDSEIMVGDKASPGEDRITTVKDFLPYVHKRASVRTPPRHRDNGRTGFTAYGVGPAVLSIADRMGMTPF